MKRGKTLKPLQVKYIEHIPAVSHRGLILARLGYRRGVTELCGDYRQFVDRAIKDALILCHLRGAYGCCDIVGRGPNQVTLENGTIFTSEKLASFLKDSEGAVLMAVTAGHEVYDKISGLMGEGDGALGVIYDSVASQVTDSALDWLMDFLNKTIGVKGRVLTRRRFSPGYGDLLLSNQKIIYDLLDLSRIDVAITESFMLLPEKTVIAIAGIGAVTSDQR